METHASLTEREKLTMYAPRPRHRLFLIFFVFLGLLQFACGPVARVTPQAPSATPTPEAPAGITLDASGLAQDVTTEIVPAEPYSGGGAWWKGTPQTRLLTLEGYPVAKHERKPQIFIYPVGELALANLNMARVAADLQALLQTRQAGDQLPFLPLANESQVLHAQVQYLDFKNGRGVRYLVQLNQGLEPINNEELIYTFQGLTRDGKTYIAAVLPVTHPDLPANSRGNEDTRQAKNDYAAYLSQVVTLLEGQPAGSFTPDLGQLDTLIRSIEVK
jgi:hypothetical protein